MYKTRKELKTQAKKALSGKWGLTLPMIVIMFFVNITLSSSYTMESGATAGVNIFSLVDTLLNVILTVGFYSFLLKICSGQKNSAIFQDLFYGFQCHPGKALLLYLLTMLYMLPGTLVYIIAVAFSTIGIFANSGISLMDFYSMTPIYDIEPLVLVGYLGIVLLLTILYLLYALYIDSTYAIVYFLLLDYPDLSTTAIWKRSAQLMKGNRLRLIGLRLSFAPWFLLCGISLVTTFLLTDLTVLLTAIIILWLTPYMSATETCFYLNLVQNQAFKKQATAVPNQMPPYATYPEPTSFMEDTANTDCSAEHTDLHETDGNNYSGIDHDTFK